MKVEQILAAAMADTKVRHAVETLVKEAAKAAAPHLTKAVEHDEVGREVMAHLAKYLWRTAGK